MLRERRIPFDVSYDSIYSEESVKRLRSSIANLDTGNKITKTMEELEKMENE